MATYIVALFRSVVERMATTHTVNVYEVAGVDSPEAAVVQAGLAHTSEQGAKLLHDDEMALSNETGTGDELDNWTFDVTQEFELDEYKGDEGRAAYDAIYFTKKED